MLANEFQSLENIYRIYVNDCKLNYNITTVSNAIFKNIWRSQYNIAIHIPKKDKCTHCHAYNKKDNFIEDENMAHENQYTYEVFKKDSAVEKMNFCAVVLIFKKYIHLQVIVYHITLEN